MPPSTPRPGRERRLTLDFALAAAIAAVAVLGLLNLRSAVSVVNLTLYETQLRWFAVGAPVVLVLWLIDPKVYFRYSFAFYAGVFVLLILVLAVGRAANQAQRWLTFGPIGLQPSEFMKIAVILTLARIFHGDARPEPRTLKDFLLPVAVTALPFVLVLKQPDLGTALIYPFVFVSMATILRIRGRTVLFVSAATVLALPLVWSMLHGYQKERITTFIDSLTEHEDSLDVRDAAWQTIQSKIAVGSGHLTGKGYMQGTQNQYGFVPFQHTDFPFAVWCEEHGFLGAVLLLLLYLFVILWCLRIASRSRDRFGALVATGVASMIFWHVTINIAMVLGMLPVVGVTLPLFSYGGSSVLANLMGIGILLSISARRQRAPWEG